MSLTKTDLRGAPIVDYTKSVPGARAFSSFGDDFTAIIRGADKPPAVIVLDRAVGIQIKEPVVVRDHLNLTGTSPLCGPNHPIGDRFPVVQGIYVEDALPILKQIVVAGIKQGLVPNEEEVALVRHLGGEACSYNIVPSMLIAAHARCRVLAILIPESEAVPGELLREIELLTGGK